MAAAISCPRRAASLPVLCGEQARVMTPGGASTDIPHSYREVIAKADGEEEASDRIDFVALAMARMNLEPRVDGPAATASNGYDAASSTSSRKRRDSSSTSHTGTSSSTVRLGSVRNREAEGVFKGA